MLRVDDLSIAYHLPTGDVAAVRHASLEVAKGESIGIVGESGSGKSTLAHAMIGYLIPPARKVGGDVRFDGTSLFGMQRADLERVRGRRIGMVHQNPLGALNPGIKVCTQVAEVVHRHAGVAWRTAREQAVEALSLVDLPDPARVGDRYPHELSGGQRQRVCIAMALVMEPDLLILDEPTTNLDATTEAVILDLIESIRRRVQASIVYISHNLAVVARVADRVAVMYAGEIVELASASALFRHPSHPYARALLACLPRPGLNKRTARLPSILGEKPNRQGQERGCVFQAGCPNSTERCAEAPDWTVIGPGQSVRCWHPDMGAEALPDQRSATSMESSDRLVLQAEGVQKKFAGRGYGRSGVQAIGGVNLQIRHGQVVGLVGESGSGKSTLLRCIAGLERCDKGALQYLGVELPTDVGARDKRVLRAIQMVFQDPESTLNPAQTIGTSLRRHLRALEGASAAAVRQRVENALAQVRLPPQYQDRLPRELSGGEKQRVAIARAFLSAPELVLCDEPLSSLDVSVQSAICQLFLDLQVENAASYIFVSHDLSIVRYMADAIVVMYQGKVVEEGPATSFDEGPVHPYTEALFSATPNLETSAGSARVRLTGQASEIDKRRPGCVFASRCHRHKGHVCNVDAPAWQEIGARRYRCHWSPAELGAQRSDTAAGAIGPAIDESLRQQGTGRPE